MKDKCDHSFKTISKQILLLFFFFGISLNIISQVEESDINIRLFYGTFYPELYNPKNFEKNYATGITGLSGEIILNKTIGFGLEFSNGSQKITSKRPHFILENINGSTALVEAYSTYEFSIFRYIATASIHVINKEKIDLSLKVGFGSYVLKGDNVLDDPFANINSTTFPSLSVISFLTKNLFQFLDDKGIPNSSRFSINGKYFFHKNIALDLGVGMGSGYLINLGLTIKIK